MPKNVLSFITGFQNENPEDISKTFFPRLYQALSSLNELIDKNQNTPAKHALTHEEPILVGSKLTGGEDLIYLDRLGPASDNTKLDATSTAHGLLPKLSGNNAEYLNGTGVFAPPFFERGGGFLDPSGSRNVTCWRAPYAAVVLNVRGYRVGGTGATINARKNGTSTHLSSDLSLSSADTWLDGGAVQNITYAAGDSLELMLTGITAAPTAVIIQVDLRRA